MSFQLKEFGMKDCRELVNDSDRIGPIKTCRFDTRIDYLFANEECLKTWSIKKLKTVDDKASDHNMVIATFKKREV